MKTLEGAELRRAIDEAIAEIDRVEEEMLELFAELLGPEAALKVVKYARAQENSSRLKALTDAESAQTGPSPKSLRP